MKPFFRTKKPRECKRNADRSQSNCKELPRQIQSHTHNLWRQKKDCFKLLLDNHVDVFIVIDMKAIYAKEIPDIWQTVSKVFTALGDEQRQRILLTFERGERLNVTQLAEASTLSRPTVSHHLKILREAGVLDSRKEGKEVFYWIAKGHLQDVLGRVLGYIDEAV
jgi:DNA-binding transcriptional ArsR family regulator